MKIETAWVLSYFHLWTHSFVKGDEHPAYAPDGIGQLYLYLYYVVDTDNKSYITPLCELIRVHD